MPIADHWFSGGGIMSRDDPRNRIQKMVVGNGHEFADGWGQEFYINHVPDGTCEAYVWSGYHGGRCCNKAKYPFEGRDFCGLHNPQRVFDRKLKKKIAWDARWAEQRHRWDVRGWEDKRDAAYLSAFREIATGKINDPAGYAQMIIEEFNDVRPRDPMAAENAQRAGAVDRGSGGAPQESEGGQGGDGQGDPGAGRAEESDEGAA